jgi:LPXTG-motif cell wall-anchored protein
MRHRHLSVATAAAHVLVALDLFLAFGGLAYAQGLPAAGDQYGTKAQGVAVSEQSQPATSVQAEQSALPNTGLSLLGAVLVGGALVVLGVALRKRERVQDSLDE